MPSVLTIHTIGHSTHPLGEFIDILKAHAVEYVADVRTIPRSRHNPQYNSNELSAALRERGIGYAHLPDLGGLRRPKKDSINTAWQNALFRGFADYMQTESFERGLERLIELGQKSLTVIMCAEAVPWRCHRSLIGDALLVRGIEVMNIMGRTSAAKHKLTAFADVHGLAVTYPKT
jgi:uncharacterized protein (DUF488 family)